MDKTLQTILWVLVILVLLSSFSTGWFFVAKERLYTDYVNLENLFKTSMERFNQEIASSHKENKELREKLEKVEQELDVLESKSKELEYDYKGLLKEKSDLDKELARVKKSKFFLEKKLKNVESNKFIAGLLKENAGLKVELKKLKDTFVLKGDLEQNLKDSMEVAEVLSEDLMREKEKNQRTQEEIDKLSEEINKLKVALGYRSKDAGELRAEAYHRPEEVELPPIVVQRGEYKQAKLIPPSYSLERIGKSSVLRGRVVTVNREHNFVVIDLGSKDGVNIGTRFDVYRETNVIGSIEAIQTRERIAAADIKREKDGFNIDTGDVIIEQ